MDISITKKLFNSIAGRESEEVGNEKIFLLDDNPIYLAILKNHVSELFPDYEVEAFTDIEEFKENLVHNPSIVLLDYELEAPSGDAVNGFKVLKHLKRSQPQCEVVMLSSNDSLHVATNSMKLGAYDYVVKNEQAFVNIKNRITQIQRKFKSVKKLQDEKIFRNFLIGVVLIGIAVGLYAEFTK